MDEHKQFGEYIVQLARLAITGRPQDVHAYLRRIIRRVKLHDEQLAEQLRMLVANAPSTASPLRDAGGAMVPVDMDSRVQLVRHENPVVLDRIPILSKSVVAKIDQVVIEREREAELARRDLTPTRSLLFVGPPGVGKTLSAQWIAQRLNKALVTLDLSSVMSSFLGKTGANLRSVLDYGKSEDCVLLLDEFDAIAKRRDDDTEIGELKRLVTVLLQEIDDWPSSGLLIAATNHEELLDRATWRRFDLVVNFPMPTGDVLERTIRSYFESDLPAVEPMLGILLVVWRERSFSDIKRDVEQLRRHSTVYELPIADALSETLAEEIKAMDLASRKQIAQDLRAAGLSGRKVNNLTGVARDTLRKMEHIDMGGV